MPGPIDGGVEDNDNNHEVEEDANPLRVVDQPQTQEIKEDNTTLNIRSANNPLRVVDPGQPQTQEFKEDNTTLNKTFVRSAHNLPGHIRIRKIS